jgi:alkylresorcinol/alkylpyrone synthase
MKMMKTEESTGQSIAFPSIVAVSKIEMPNRVEQKRVKEYAKELFMPSFPQVERIMSAFDNTGIITRNFCKSIDYYLDSHTYQEFNRDYIETSLEYSIEAIEKCISSAKIDKDQVTDIIFVSTTGLATPSLDALIINKMRLNQNTSRIPDLWIGLCRRGSGIIEGKCILAKANPDAVVLLVVVELCSLTFLKSDFSKSNFIGSSLFSDGVVACLVMGANHKLEQSQRINYLAAQSKLYYDSLDVMGWEFQEQGFKVLFSQDIPTIISRNIYDDVISFLKKNNLELSDIKNFIFHPGGKKVLTAYEEALPVGGDFLKNTREVMNENGNMSAATVLYVLERFMDRGFENGYGLMLSMGPGFSSEMVLLGMENN